MKILRPIFYDQLSISLASLNDVAPEDIILMCEVIEETKYVEHHPKKIALWFSAMRHFAEELKQKGFNVFYVNLTDSLNTQTFTNEVHRVFKSSGAMKIIITEPSEYRLKKMIESWQILFDTIIEIRSDNRFLCSIKTFENWAQDKKQLRMEYFYRDMRKKYNILMEPNGKPTGGEWNYDKENRKPPPSNLRSIQRIMHKKSEILKDVLTLVKDRFSDHFGDLEPFHYAVSNDQAILELDHFIEFILPYFGDYQDIMLKDQAYLNHSLLSSYINLGLLLPLEICKKAENAYRAGKAPLNAVEGFIRQILGWREFIRGIYWLKMPNYGELNYLEAKNSLPNFYWGSKTHMECISEAISHTKIHSYSHHIQRLMVTGNFALLAGLDVKQVQKWYLSVYSDAYEWVEMPNTLGMALFGDGGIVGSKPYAASGQYINKMSNFCKQCRYDVKESLTPNACPFNALYWDFLQRNRNKLDKNSRLSFIYKIWDKFDIEKKQSITIKALDILKSMKENEL